MGTEQRKGEFAKLFASHEVLLTKVLPLDLHLQHESEWHDRRGGQPQGACHVPGAGPRYLLLANGRPMVSFALYSKECAG